MNIKDIILQDESMRKYDISEIIKIDYLQKSCVFIVYLKTKELVSPLIKDEIQKILKEKTKIDAKVEFVNILEEITDSNIRDVFSGIFKVDPLKNNFFKDSNISIAGNNINISHFSQVLLNNFEDCPDMKSIKSNLKDFYDFKGNIIFSLDNELIPEKKDDELNSTLKKIQEENKQNSFKMKSSKKKSKSKNGYTLGREIKDSPTLIKDLDDNSGRVTIMGEVFKIEERKLRNAKKLLSIYVTDHSSSIILKIFLKENEEIESLKEGNLYLYRGKVTYDMYSKELTMIVKDINELEKKVREDLEDEKRVELHAHTNMSTMDAIASPREIVEKAKSFGHKAVAITDHGVVQGFPEASAAGKEHGVKIIYGMEAYMVNDETNIIENIKDDVKDFLVFDIETTGFSYKNNKIIEIGGARVRDGEIIDTFSTFVNPEVKIPFKITELTGITDSMVKDAPLIDEVILDFNEFIKDSILVAHNAYFDVGFIKKNLKDQNISIDNPVLDTVPLARYVYKDLKRHRLDVIAKHIGIDMGSHHRALDDAFTTVRILEDALNKLNEMGIHDFHSLNEKSKEEMDVTKLPTFHVTLLAKNYIGLKNLYEMVSSSHIDTFHINPRIRKSMLREKREGLLLGSACKEGELSRFILEGREEDEVRKEVDFYDFIEIAPISNNLDLLKSEKVMGFEGLQEYNKNLIALAESLDKIPVVTGNVHFLDKEDKTLRKIVLGGKAFNFLNDDLDLYFKTTDEMLSEFSYLGKDKAKEVVVLNSNKINGMIDDLIPIPEGTFPPSIEGSEKEIRDMTMDKAHFLYGETLPEIVKKRIDKELNSIISNGYAVLYLVAHKLVDKSLKDGYLVGSRGSVGSSLVATLTGITEVNGLPPHYRCPKCKKSEFILDGSISSGADLPKKKCPDCGVEFERDGHDIPFETFLGFEGDKEPDIDLNFSGEYQATVHKYTEELFGEGYVFKAGTIGTVANKTAYAFVKKYFDEREMNLSSAEIERYIIGITGVKRTTGQHPGGIIVVPRDNDVHNFTPVQRPANDQKTDVITTHFDYRSIEGRLLKLDILGHDDPTTLRMLEDLTGLNPMGIPLNDKKVISLFTSTNALGVSKEDLGFPLGSLGLPEFGTSFVRSMLLDTKPESFADLVRISGLSHGTDVWLNNAQSYIKDGDTTLQNCISTRDDIMVYLMQKGLPSKTSFVIMEGVRKGRGLTEDQEKTMKEYDIPPWYIESCKKIKYMFPKGHAVAYVMMAVRIAYYKVYYPLAYYASYFTNKVEDFDGEVIIKGEDAINLKLKELSDLGNDASNKEKNMMTVLELAFEMHKRGFKFKNVDLYGSDACTFKIEDGKLMPPLSSLVGVGLNAAKNIYEEAKISEFISKEDIRKRCKVSKTVIAALEEHGVLDGLDDTNQISFFSM